jgi:drug/metabolite transporter (DMT)-like permease
MVWFCVLVRLIANPLSYVYQKLLTQQAAAPPFVVGVTYGLLALVSVPVLISSPPPASLSFWLNMAACAVLAVAANEFLVLAIRISDLSLLGPVSAYKSVVSLLPGIVLLHELPGPWALAGIALIVAGSFLLVDRRPGEDGRRRSWGQLIRNRGVQFRLVALGLSAVEAIFLKKALLSSTPLTTLAVWSTLGFLLALPSMIVRRGCVGGGQFSLIRTNGLSYSCLALFTGLMQLATLVVLTGFHVAAALALFQTSTLLTVLVGAKLFHEPHFVQRFFGSLVMVAGATLVVLTR